MVWEATNQTNQVLQIDPSMTMRQRSDKSVISIQTPEFTTNTQILPNHTMRFFSIKLTPGEVDHYRHWAKECDAFGFKDTSGKEYWINNDQFQKLKNDLQNIAIAFGLSAEVPKGKSLLLKINRNQTTNTSLNHDTP